jgi:hypothetical protein
MPVELPQRDDKTPSETHSFDLEKDVKIDGERGVIVQRGYTKAVCNASDTEPQPKCVYAIHFPTAHKTETYLEDELKVLDETWHPTLTGNGDT